MAMAPIDHHGSTARPALRVVAREPWRQAGHRLDPELRRGRGATINPDARYETQAREIEDDGWGSLGELSPIATAVAVQHARPIITRN